MNETTNTTKSPAPVAVGDIFRMSWGYDQTNVNYFQVTRVTAKGCYVREIGCETVPGTEGMDCCHVRPAPGNFLAKSQWCVRRTWNEAGDIPLSADDKNPETFRRVYLRRNDEPGISFEGHYFASRVSADSTTYNSWYH